MPHAVAVLSLLLSAAVPSEPGSDDGEIQFARDVRPILSDKCLFCHGPDPETREAGLRLDTKEGAFAALASGGHAVVAGDIEESDLVYRITTDFEFDHMPPERSGKSLSEEEVATLVRWIEAGAPWDDHWSFVTPTRPEVPPLGLEPIDAFISEQLAREELALRAEAAPSTLLRRVTLDLTGLPPSPEEASAFLDAVAADGVDAAYAAAVDRLLASPRYGVHMARTWLDAARYADTHGLHLDNRRSMWPYRDWVVDAFNAGMPFDEFTVKQLAGDLLEGATLEDRVASGFNRCNPTSAEGGMIAQEYLSIYAKDRVDTTSTIWLGLTMACAQCHDHKYDPLTQRDYYSMYAFFNSLDEDASDRNIENPRPFLQVPTEEQSAELEELVERTGALTAELDRDWPELDARQATWLETRGGEARRSWRVLLPERAEATGGATLEAGPDGVVVASGENPAKNVYTIDAYAPEGALHGLRIDALVGEGRTRPGRATNQNFVLSTVEVLAAPAGRPEELAPVPLAAAVATHSQDRFSIEGVLDQDPETGWAGLGLDGDRSALLRFGRAIGFPGGTELRVVLRFESRHAAHSFERVRLAVKRTDEEPAGLAFGPWTRATVDAETAGGLFAAAREAGSETTAEAAAPELREGEILRLPARIGVTTLRTTLRATRDTSATLLFGSDDGLLVWIDGEEVHANDVGRPVRLDQDRVEVELAAGEHEMVCKVVNGGGAAGFVYRFEERSAEDDFPPELELSLSLRGGGALDGSAAEEVTRIWRRRFAPAWAALETERDGAREAAATLRASLPTTMVSAERMDPRPAHVQMRGAYDRLGDVVTANTPGALPAFPEDLPRDRLGLARWLVAPENPLTARVWVNRAWQHFFGRGLVATPEDFGAQGAWPSHPELLDWLAVEFVESGWDVKGMHRRLALSRAYRQDAAVTPELLELDPDNVLVSRGPRHRLDGEVIRDQALYAAGLLDESMGGPGVYPYQPDGVWFAVGYSRSNTVRYSQGPEEHLHRRSLYTFWKRTAPPPNLTTFDAPMRDACVVKRERTNTPLQALVTLNDPTYVEAARFLAARILDGPVEVDGAARRVDTLFELVLGREAASHEEEALLALVADLEANYLEDEAAAAALLGVGALPMPPTEHAGLEPAEHAAWTLAASAVLNLDEALSKN